jgi:copper chaperone
MSDVYRVDGMTCHGCVRAVSNALQANIPHAGITVDLQRGLVCIDGQVDEAVVRAAVEQAGFQFKGKSAGDY